MSKVHQNVNCTIVDSFKKTFSLVSISDDLRICCKCLICGRQEAETRLNGTFFTLQIEVQKYFNKFIRM